MTSLSAAIDIVERLSLLCDVTMRFIEDAKEVEVGKETVGTNDCLPLIVPGEEVPELNVRASRICLAMESEFFLKLFTSKMQDAMQHIVDVHIAPGQANACKILIRSTMINDNDIRDELTKSSTNILLSLVRVCDRFEMKKLRDTALEALFSHEDLTVSNYEDCLSLPIGTTMSETFSKQKPKLEQFLLTKFGDLDNALNEEHAEYKGLGPQSVALLLNSPSLKLYSENSTFTFALKWFEAWKASCEESSSEIPDCVVHHVVKILKNFRYEHFTTSFLLTVVAVYDWTLPDGRNLTDNNAVQEEITRRLATSTSGRLAACLIRNKSLANNNVGQGERTERKTRSGLGEITCDITKSHFEKERKGTMANVISKVLGGYVFLVQAGRMGDNYSSKHDTGVQIRLLVLHPSNQLREAHTWVDVRASCGGPEPFQYITPENGYSRHSPDPTNRPHSCMFFNMFCSHNEYNALQDETKLEVRFDIQRLSDKRKR